VRQFIRLLKLLEPQIKRHDQDELRWPAILVANVIKVTYPRLANALLNDIDFWGDTQQLTMLDPSDEKDQLTAEVTKHVEKVDLSQNAKLSPAERAEIVRALMPLCSNISMWFGDGAEVQSYQMNIAEAPHAVTRKEFKEFCAAWEIESSAKGAKAWIASHAIKVERQSIEVYRELLDSVLDCYLTKLGQRENVQLEEERQPILKQAQALSAMLECLVFELGQLDTPDKKLRPEELEILFEAVARNLQSSALATDNFCQRNEELLMQIIRRWQGDVSPLVDAILPYGHWGSRRYDGPNAQALHRRLSAAILPRLAAQVIGGLRESGYVHRIWTQSKEMLQIRCLFLAHDGPLWKDARKELLEAVKAVGSNRIVQENVYELLHWFYYGLTEKAGTGDAASLKKLFEDKELLDGLWAAATAKTLSPHATITLNNFVLSLKAVGISLTIPAWWDAAIKQIALPKVVNQPPENETNQPA
jgi:hypothetical protein